MGSFDCYCALCGGPLGIGNIKFGSRNPKLLRKRRERVRKARQAEGSGNDNDDDGDEEMEDAPSDVDNMEEQHENPFAKKDEPSWGDDAESDSDYAPSASSDVSSYSGSNSNQSASSDLHTGDIEDVSFPPPSPPSPDRRDPDSWSQWSDLSIWEGFDPYISTDRNDRDEYYEKYAYDPALLQPDDVWWIDRCRCLSFNAGAPGVTKTYISGRGRYEDYGGFSVGRQGLDPNDTGEDNLTCFFTYGGDQESSFPFHEECYKILAKSLGYKKYQEIDKDVLYGVMSTYLEEYGRELSLDYGDGNGREQFWCCLPGEEYVVCDPRFRPELAEFWESMLPATLMQEYDFLPLSGKVGQDPFSVMPYDILLNIFSYSSTDSMLNLIRASTHVMETTRSTPFWKYMLRLRILPWFQEIEPLLDRSVFTQTIDYKGVFLWSFDVTAPKYGQEGPLMGIANRRRIHRACQELRSLYRERVTPSSYAQPADEEAEAILREAESLHMPMVLFPQQKSAQTISAQFIRSWHEVGHQPCDFDTYWNDGGALIGIAVTFGRQQRVFGSINGKPGLTFHIETDEYISEIRIFFGDCNMLDERTERRNYRTALDVKAAGEAHIEGLQVTLSSGRSKSFNKSRHNQRPFIVLPNMYLVGLTGQVAPNGVISRLGLLQSFHPDCRPRNPKTYRPVQTTLWSPGATSLFYQPNRTAYPIWSHPYYKLHTFRPTQNDSGDIPRDVLPHEIFLWAEAADRYQFLTTIEAFVVVSGQCMSGNDTWDIPDLIGFRSVGTHRYGNPPFIGNGGPVPSMNVEEWRKGMSRGKEDDGKPLNPSDLNLRENFKQWDPEFMQRFEIDGAGGEVVTEVHVSDDYKAIRLVTNLERQCYWGEERRGHWLDYVAGEDEVILGLSVCFGRLGGWSWSAKMYSHWRVSEIGVVLGKKDGEKW